MNRFKVKWAEFYSVLRTEYGNIFKDAGVILILVFAIIIYATLYSMAYNNQVLRNIPVAVIDNSHTPASRQLINTFNAGPNINIKYNPSGMEEAKDLFYSREINGIIYIPEDYERKLLRGEPTKVGVYVDASYFLMYRQVFSDVVAGISGTGGEISFIRLLSQGATVQQAEATAQPVTFNIKNLYNPYLGYGTFIMPAIIIVIIQQTLLIGIGMIGGTWREFGMYKSIKPPGEKRLSVLPLVLGKTIAYMSVYAITIPYILAVHYKWFGYPMRASFIDILLFMTPYILSCIFLGITLSTLFRKRENSILFMLWTSIPMLLISGASIPKEAIPEWMLLLGKIFPSSSGVDGFLRLQTTGASLNEISQQINTLWILAGVYLITACISMRLLLNRTDVK